MLGGHSDGGLTFKILLIHAAAFRGAGGRVTDDKDRRLLAALLSRCYCSEAVEAPGHALSASGSYHIPLDSSSSGSGSNGMHSLAALTRPALAEFVAGLPGAAAPEAFGLGENADITKDLNDTSRLLSSLLSVTGGGGGGAGGSLDTARVARLVAEVLGRLPLEFDLEAVGARWPVCYDNSMNTVLVQVRFVLATYMLP